MILIFLEFEWVIFIELQQTNLITQPNKKEISQMVGTELNGVFLQKNELKKEEKKLFLDHLPNLSSFAQIFKETGII